MEITTLSGILITCLLMTAASFLTFFFQSYKYVKKNECQNCKKAQEAIEEEKEKYREVKIQNLKEQGTEKHKEIQGRLSYLCRSQKSIEKMMTVCVLYLPIPNDQKQNIINNFKKK